MFVIIITVDKKTGEIIKSPDIISRGFVYLKESRELLKESRQKAIQIVKDIMNNGGNINWNNVKSEIRKRIGQSLYSRTQRRPMVLPVIIEV
jgi:ribonuclease J